jgi:protein-L-isoaspartate(D-aspartate) O-methyltransferase
MVGRQLRDRGIGNQAVLEVMGEMPRERFVPPEHVDLAYGDGALPIPWGQSISQPYMVALMTALLEPRPGMLVLEIGTGTGYQAAVLARLGCRVISVERHPALAGAARERLAELGLGDTVRIEVGDGSLGRPEDAPFDGIVVTAAAPRVPPALVAQLADGGRLVVPVGPERRQELRLVVRSGDAVAESRHGSCVFVPLIGAGGFAERHGPGGRFRRRHV